MVAFQSAPVIADGRTPIAAERKLKPAMFQSAPVIADGRTPHRPRRGLHRGHGFNPRPSSLTGEPLDGANTSPQETSFNPRPSSLTGEPR